MITDTGFIKETKIFKLSTQSSAGVCLNDDTNYKSSFQYQFPIMNLKEEDIVMTCISIPYVCIPISFYNIDYHNNELDMIITGIDSVTGLQASSNVIITFPSGNYNTISFMAQFKKVMFDNWAISLDNLTNRFTISTPRTDIISFQLLSTSTISSVMGFSSTLSSTNKQIVLPRTCNFRHTPRIHLRCGELANGYMINKNYDSDILLSIPNDSTANGKIVYREFMNNSTHLETSFIQTLTFNFTDENSNLLNFNGISSYFEIQLEIYRKRPERPPTFRNLVKELSKILE